MAATWDGQIQLMFRTEDERVWHTIRQDNGTWTDFVDVTSVLHWNTPVVTLAATGDGNPGETQFWFTTAVVADVTGQQYGGSLGKVVRHLAGDWIGIEEVEHRWRVRGPVTAVAATWDGSYIQFMMISNEQLWHVVRKEDGDETTLLEENFTGAAQVTAIAATWDGKPGETQFMIIAGERLWHTIRDEHGSWTDLSPVRGPFDVRDPVTTVAASWDGKRGETQFIFTTADGQLWHTIRQDNGSWTGPDLVTVPGAVHVVSVAGDGEPGEAQFIFFAT